MSRSFTLSGTPPGCVGAEPVVAFARGANARAGGGRSGPGLGGGFGRSTGAPPELKTPPEHLQVTVELLSDVALVQALLHEPPVDRLAQSLKNCLSR